MRQKGEKFRERVLDLASIAPKKPETTHTVSNLSIPPYHTDYGFITYGNQKYREIRLQL